MPTRPSSRILFFGILVCGTVLWASYQASLTSTLTVILTKVPVATLEDAVAQGFTLGIWKGTAIEDIMRASPDGSLAQKAYQSINDYSFAKILFAKLLIDLLSAGMVN